MVAKNIELHDYVTNYVILICLIWFYDIGFIYFFKFYNYDWILCSWNFEATKYYYYLQIVLWDLCIDNLNQCNKVCLFTLGRCGTMGERSVTIVQQHLKLGKQLNGIDFLFVLNFWHVKLVNIDYKI